MYVSLCGDVIMPPFQMKYITDYVFMFQLKFMDFACIAQLFFSSYCRMKSQLTTLNI